MPRKKKSSLQRFSKDSQRKREQRLSQTDEEKSEVKNVDREKKAEKRANESEDEKSERLFANKLRNQKSRKSEKIDDKKQPVPSTSKVSE